MIQMQTRLAVADNTGAKEVMCIKVLGGSRRRYAGPGRRHHLQRQERDPRQRSQEEGGRPGVVVRTKQPTRRNDGSYVRFDTNAVVLIDNDNNPRGHAHLRRRGPRAARPEFHEDRQPGERGGVAMLIRTDDTVEVIAGDDSGKQSRVLAGRSRGGQGVVEGVNRVYKHVRRSQKNPQGGRLSKEMPVQMSNVALVCGACGKATRTGRALHRRTAPRSGSARSAAPRPARSPRRKKAHATQEVSKSGISAAGVDHDLGSRTSES